MEPYSPYPDRNQNREQWFAALATIAVLFGIGILARKVFR